MRNDKTGSALRYKLEGRVFDSRWGHGIFHWLKTSGRTMALGSTQILTEMSTNKGGRCVELTTQLPSCTDSIEILKTSAFWSPKGPSRPVQGLIYNSVLFWRSILGLNEKGLECVFDQFMKIFWIRYDAEVCTEGSFTMSVGNDSSQ
jgi:hypothetical protein